MSTWIDLKNNPRLRKIYETRLAIVRHTREFFWERGFVEAETPLALRYPSQEPYLSFFPLTVKHTSGKEYQTYLRTSPEFALKKLLAAGFTKIFEIGKCFRNEEDFGGSHNPEFTMIEWYRTPGTYLDFMDDLENLFKCVGKKIGITKLAYKKKEVALYEPWDRLSMREVWQKYVRVDLNDYLELELIQKLAVSKGYAVSDSDEYEDIFFKIFLNEIEGKLGVERPLFVYDYPTHMTSLSRVSKNDPRYAERVECYVAGLEICNGFGELTDPVVQKKLLERDKCLRAKLGRPTWPVDEDFISALQSLPQGTQKGVPVCQQAGVALGMDRMVVLCTGANDINEVLFGSMKDQIE